MKYSFEDSIIKIKAVKINTNPNVKHLKFNIDNELYFILKINEEDRNIFLERIMYKKEVIDLLNYSLLHTNINMYFSQLSDALSTLIFSNNRKIINHKEIILLISKIKYLNENSLFKEFECLDDIRKDASLLFRIHDNMLYIMNIGTNSYLLSITNRLIYEPDKNQLMVSKVKSYDFLDVGIDNLKKVESLYGKCDLETLFFIYNELQDERNWEMQKVINKNFLSLV